MASTEQLASYQHAVARIHASWSDFGSKRVERLKEKERYGHAAERATERGVKV